MSTEVLKKKKFLRHILMSLGLALLAFFILVTIREYLEVKSKDSWSKPAVNYQDYQQDKTAVLGENDQQELTVENDGTTLKSENYKVSQVSIGGELLADFENSDKMSVLELMDIKNELFVTKNKEEIKMLISWKTNKTTKGYIEYAKEGDSDFKKIEVNNNGLSHSALVSNLDPSSVYTYTITSQDKWGTEKKSDKYVFYTGAPNVSLIDVLENAAKKVFGWAM